LRLSAIGKESDTVRRTLWLTALALMIAGFLLAPGDCRAEAKCPWLNAATAGGLLGGEVKMAVTAPADPGPVKGVGQASYPDQIRMDRFDTSCEFTRKADDGVYTLRIAVKTMGDPATEFGAYVAQCGGTSRALKAIGNEAVQCLAKDGSAPDEERVVARVRERAFVLTVSRTGLKPIAPGADLLRDDTRNIAEQVAGSLF
jgi:hypothetical protein